MSKKQSKKTGLQMQGVDIFFQDAAETSPDIATASNAQARPDNQPGSELQKSSTLRQTTVMLYDEEMDWLDQKVIEVRQGGGKGIRKAGLIRALINLAMHTEVDLKAIQSEAELTDRFAEAIKNK